MTCSWYIIHSLFIYLSHWSFIITCSCLSCFSMNIHNMPDPHRATRPLDSTSWYELCPAHTGSRGSMILMPGPHRVTRQLHNRPNTDNHKQLGPERQQPTSEHPCQQVLAKSYNPHQKHEIHMCVLYKYTGLGRENIIYISGFSC